MRQDSNDIIIKVITEWEQYEVRLNFDTGGTDLIRHFTNIMKGMTFSSNSIISSLKEVANEMEEDMQYYNENKEEEDEYATTD